METITFKDFLNSALMTSSTESIVAADIIISIFVSLICAIITFYVYKNTFQGVLYQKTYGVSIVLIALITTVVIATVSGNLILSLGMVGALSIVRFRTAIKDPLDIVFMFWAISIGVANGVMAYKISIISTFLFAIILIAMSRIKSYSSPNVLVATYSSSFDEEISELIANHTKSFVVKSKSVSSGVMELVADVRTRDEGRDLTKLLSEHLELKSFSLINYSNDISGV